MIKYENSYEKHIEVCINSACSMFLFLILGVESEKNKYFFEIAYSGDNKVVQSNFFLQRTVNVVCKVLLKKRFIARRITGGTNKPRKNFFLFPLFSFFFVGFVFDVFFFSFLQFG